MSTPLDSLSKGAQSILGRALTQREQDSFIKYLDLLVKWQGTHRFVGSAQPEWIVENLLLDSLLFLRVLPSPLRSLCDLGSGAGVPGIPIKIVRADLTLVLVESRRRRASFLSSAIRELGIANARVVAGRVEDHMAQLAGRFDAVVMRCTGHAEALLPTAAELVSKTGVVVAAGPPTPKPTPLGEWLTVEGWPAGRSRRFLVYRSA